MDVAQRSGQRSLGVGEAQIDAFISRRDTQRRKSEGERAEHELWMESERLYFERESRRLRWAWVKFYENQAERAVANGMAVARANRARAQAELERDPSNLDADNDGIACEELRGSIGTTAGDQYAEDQVIGGSIPNKGKLANTGGSPLILLAGAALLSMGLLLGRYVIRRAP